MYPYLFKKVKQEYPILSYKHTLLLVALLLEEKMVILWKPKGPARKLAGNTRSHQQRLKHWLRLGQQSKDPWIGLLQAALRLLPQSVAR